MSDFNSTLTQAQLKEMLDYNPVNGIFRWKVSTNNRAHVGAVAGCLAKSTGYRVIRKGRSLAAAHRLAWLYVHGVWPVKGIDHIDGNKSNNAITNLREASQIENQQNQKSAHRDSASNILGVSLDKRRDLWKAEIKANKVRKFLGYFNTAQEAGDAYINAKRQVHPFGTL